MQIKKIKMVKILFFSQMNFEGFSFPLFPELLFLERTIWDSLYRWFVDDNGKMNAT